MFGVPLFPSLPRHPYHAWLATLARIESTSISPLSETKYNWPVNLVFSCNEDLWETDELLIARSFYRVWLIELRAILSRKLSHDWFYKAFCFIEFKFNFRSMFAWHCHFMVAVPVVSNDYVEPPVQDLLPVIKLAPCKDLTSRSLAY